MTFLLLQTFVLLLASYFVGAFLACTVKRAILGSRREVSVHVVAPIAVEASVRPPVIAIPAPSVRTRVVPPPVAARSIDPVQPRIDVLRRPEPRPAPKLIDPSRFERALMGPDPNEGIPRKAIAEIRPAILRPVTGAYRPGTYGPQPEPEPEPVIEPVPLVEKLPEPPQVKVMPPAPPKVEAQPEPLATITPTPQPGKRLSLVDATTAAAAAAVAVAKAAAAASVAAMPRTPAPAKSKPEDTLPPPEAKAPVEQKPAEKPETKPETKPADKPAEAVKPVEKAAEKFAAPPPPAAKPQPIARAPVEGGDDFQRIRAIDADLEQRLKAEGVGDFEHMAAWTAADVKRISQSLGIPGRIDREQWVEQAQILAKGGETYYSRNRLAAQKAATPVEKSAISETAAKVVQAAVMPPPKDQPQSPPAKEPRKESATSVPQIKPAAPASTPTPTQSQLSGVAAASQGRSVAEMAFAAAAAIAAASASVTRGLKPIEPISPLSRVDPKISIPARLSDAIREKGAALASAAPRSEVEPPKPMPASSQGPRDDLKRIRGVGVLIEKRLNAIGISRYDQIANWTSSDSDRVDQLLEFKGRIERESWVEQARILSSGGYTEFSRRVDRGEVDTSRET